jgi:hypothetical protein
LAEPEKLESSITQVLDKEFAMVHNQRMSSSVAIEKGPERKYRAATIWGQKLLGSGWTGVSHYFFEFYPALNITHQEALFLLNLVSYSSFKGKEEHRPFPGLATIADRLGCDKRRARALAKSLEDKGLITRIFRKAEADRNETNLWDLQPLMDKLENLLLFKQSNGNKRRPKKVQPGKISSDEVSQVDLVDEFDPFAVRYDPDEYDEFEMPL